MSFDVASIRPSKPGTFTPPNFPLSNDDSYGPTAGIFEAHFPLIVYIEFAYKLRLTLGQRESMLANLPKWIAADSFTIQARAPGNPSKNQMRLMMQSLLAERFKLAIHFETKQSPYSPSPLSNLGRRVPSCVRTPRAPRVMLRPRQLTALRRTLSRCIHVSAVCTVYPDDGTTPIWRAPEIPPWN